MSACSRLSNSTEEVQLPPELWHHVFYFSDRNNNLATGKVCRDWRTLTIQACRAANRDAIRHFVSFLRSQNSFQLFDAELSEISDTFNASHSASLKTPEQIDRSFWTAAGKILSILKKTTSQHRNQIERALGDRLPDSLRNIFEIARLSLNQAIQRKNFGTFCIVFHSLPPLSNEDQKNAVKVALRVKHAGILRILLALRPYKKKRELQIARKGIQLNPIPVLQLVRIPLDKVLLPILKLGYKKNKISVCSLVPPHRTLSSCWMPNAGIVRVTKKAFKKNKIAFLHPSLDPISDRYLEKRVKLAKKAIKEDKDEFAKAVILQEFVLDDLDQAEILKETICRRAGAANTGG